MPQLEPNRDSDPNTADPRWNSLYKLSGAAALIAVLIFRRWLGEEFLLLRSLGIIHVGPRALPSSVIDWFTLLHTQRFIGLTLLNVFDLVNYALVGLMFLGLYASLRRVNRSYMTLAMALGIVGIAVYFASNQAFSMLSLSEQYASATTDAQRSVLLAAGQALLAISNTGVFGQTAISFLFVNLAGLIISMVMLRSGIFGKATAYVGILANGFGLGYPIGLILAPKVLVLAVISLSASACFLVIWYIQIARRLFQLGYGKPHGSA
jgi:hypothetical protein